MHLLHQRREGFRPVDVLVHALERRARDRLETDAQHRATAFGGEFEHAVVLRELGGDAGLPLDAAALQRAHDLLATLWRAEKVGVVDRDRARTAILHLLDHFVHWPIAEFEAVHQRFGAEGAALMTAPRGLYECLIDVSVLLEEV